VYRTSEAEVIGPRRIIPRLEDRADHGGAWLVSPPMDGERFSIIEASLEQASLRVIQGAVGQSRIRVAWYLNEHVADLYRHLLRSLDYLLRNVPKPHVVNLSLGPPMKHAPLDPEDPIHVIVDAATKAGMLLVLAHGNAGAADGSKDGIINPWASPRWAIGVGACNAEGTEVMPSSSRGAADRPETWPDLVAPGFAELDPTRVGTSYAAPRVVAAADQIIHFLRGFVREAGPEMALKLRVPKETVAAGLALGPRMAGRRLPWDEDGCPVFEYDPTSGPALVRQLLRDFTRPLPGVGPHVAGAGVLDGDRLYDELGVFGRSTAKILPIRIL
jgi:subtilisin family serine protease